MTWVETTFVTLPLLHCADDPSSNDPRGAKSNMESLLAERVHSISEFVIFLICMTTCFADRNIWSDGDIQPAVLNFVTLYVLLNVGTCTECAMIGTSLNVVIIVEFAQN